MQIHVEDRAEGDRFLPPLTTSRFSLAPLSPTRDEWSLRFQSPFDPGPPLAAFYSGFEIETSDTLGAGPWQRRASVPATNASYYDWLGALAHEESLYVRVRGVPAD